MTTVELNAVRNELARDILTTENMEVLKAVRRVYRRAMNKVAKQAETTPQPYTIEELNERIDKAEAETGGMPSTAFFAEMEHEMPWLCK